MTSGARRDPSRRGSVTVILGLPPAPPQPPRALGRPVGQVGAPGAPAWCLSGDVVDRGHTSISRRRLRVRPVGPFRLEPKQLALALQAFERMAADAFEREAGPLNQPPCDVG